MSQLLSSKAPVKRRKHSKAFKAQVLEACGQPGVSIAAVAQQFHLNANLIHTWRRDGYPSQNILQPTTRPAFLPIPITGTQTTLPSTAQVSFELVGIKVSWPLSHIDQSIPWLRALQS